MTQVLLVNGHMMEVLIIFQPAKLLVEVQRQNIHVVTMLVLRILLANMIIFQLAKLLVEVQ